MYNVAIWFNREWRIVNNGRDLTLEQATNMVKALERKGKRAGYEQQGWRTK